MAHRRLSCLHSIHEYESAHPCQLQRNSREQLSCALTAPAAIHDVPALHGTLTKNHQHLATGLYRYDRITSAGIETPLCSRFEAMKFQVLYIGEPTKRSGRKDTSYLKCPPSLTGIAHLTWTHDNITIVYTHPLMTWALLAPYLTQIEVIVLADAILRASSGSMTVANISRFLDGADAFPSRRKCIDALVFLDAVTDSTMECRCTLVMLRHGLPQPVKHWKILIPELAHEATVDIAYPKQRVIIEYDGDAHRRDKRQYRWDERKRQALRAMGYTVIVVFADDILTSQGRRRFAQRVAKALDTTCRNRPHPKFRALLADDRAETARQRQRRYRARERRKGRRV